MADTLHHVAEHVLRTPDILQTNKSFEEVKRGSINTQSKAPTDKLSNYVGDMKLS